MRPDSRTAAGVTGTARRVRPGARASTSSKRVGVALTPTIRSAPGNGTGVARSAPRTVNLVPPPSTNAAAMVLSSLTSRADFTRPLWASSMIVTRPPGLACDVMAMVSQIVWPRLSASVDRRPPARSFW